jgi:uncharacterized membrane protein YdbT with pleckstrin-like domain
MDLESGETVIFEGHPSWRSIIGFYLEALLLAAVVGVVVALAASTAAGVGAGVAVLALGIVAGWLRRLFTAYVITDRRLYIKRGFIARHEQQTQLSRVQNVNTNQSVLQRLLVVGNVDFDTAAGDDFDFSFKGVGSPQEVVQAVHRAQEVGQPV